jgi:hypothetical protein
MPLILPIHYVRGHRDINMPPTRKAWSARRAPQYHRFRYQDVLSSSWIPKTPSSRCLSPGSARATWKRLPRRSAQCPPGRTAA